MYDDLDIHQYDSKPSQGFGSLPWERHAKPLLDGRRVVLKSTGSVWYCEKHRFVAARNCWRVKLMRLDGTNDPKWVNDDEVVALPAETREPTPIASANPPVPMPTAKQRRTRKARLELSLPPAVCDAIKAHCAREGVSCSEFVAMAVAPFLQNR